MKTNAALDAEEKRVKKRVEKLRKSLSQCQEELERIRQERLKLRLMPLIGIADGVRYTGRGDNRVQCNETGTLLEVRKTRASVQLAGTKWDIPLADLLPATLPPVEFIAL